jgi:uncharacterized protein YdhG (YjbR/CyaY superfamily)
VKKAKSGHQRAAAPGKAVPKNFAEYLATAPKPARSALLKMRGTIRATVPKDATEVISYRIPAFKDKNGVLVWFAAFSDHCSLFPKASVIEAFQEELSGFTTSKGTVQFPLDKPLPVKLIRKLVKARVQEAGGRANE